MTLIYGSHFGEYSENCTANLECIDDVGWSGKPSTPMQAHCIAPHIWKRSFLETMTVCDDSHDFEYKGGNFNSNTYHWNVLDFFMPTIVLGVATSIGFSADIDS
ncbi:uncharacterized protein [Hetaerina americana]|uniref:uncharacterized protein n=1 Tax=Hetaerina americana TaxID=62018 RepID=UPI003A7F1FF4